MNKRITIHTENSIYVVDPEEVVFCKCEATSIIIYLKNGETLEISKQMDALEQVFEGSGFIRSHQDFLVNRNYILRMDLDEVTLVLTNQLKIPIEEKAEAEILELIKLSN